MRFIGRNEFEESNGRGKRRNDNCRYAHIVLKEDGEGADPTWVGGEVSQGWINALAGLACRWFSGRHYVLPFSLDRFTATRSCAPQVRIIVTSESTRFTRTFAVLPPAVVYGRPMTSYSPVSSVSRSPICSCIGSRRRSGGFAGSSFFSRFCLAMPAESL